MAYPPFSDCVSHALYTLKMPHLSLKKEQISSMEAIYNRRDVFMWLPTGYGKSICYQALPFIMNYKHGQEYSLVIVVSPLIALMIDQVTSLRRKNIKCSIITSSADCTNRDLQAREINLQTDSLLFCTPEALVHSRWRQLIDCEEVSQRIVCYVIDEAHCVSKW